MSLRKSEFTGKTTILDADTLDFVSSGQNYKITYSDLKTLMGIGNGNPDSNIHFTAIDYTIPSEMDYVVGTGTITLTMPVTPTKAVNIKNNGVGTITLDPGTNTIENSSTVATTAARKFIFDETNTEWLEL